MAHPSETAASRDPVGIGLKGIRSERLVEADMGQVVLPIEQQRRLSACQAVVGLSPAVMHNMRADGRKFELGLVSSGNSREKNNNVFVFID